MLPAPPRHRVGQWLGALQASFWGRLAAAVIHRIRSGELALRAMGLAYLTLLALVPLLAVCFAVLKTFGVHGELAPTLQQMLSPLGEQSESIAAMIIAFVESVQVGVLGFTGIAFLFYTIISLMQRIERSVNALWHIPNNRSLARTFSDYLSVILIGPVLLFSAFGLRTAVYRNETVQTLLAVEPFGAWVAGAGQVLPLVLVCATFAFLYGLIPNTRVRLGAALAGGIFAGLLWSASGALFATFVVRSSNYSAVYSGFAGVVLFILWLQLAWLIILVGAQVAYCWQHPQAPPSTGDADAIPPRPERTALGAMALAVNAYRDAAPVTAAQVAAALDLSAEHAGAIIGRLLAAGLLFETRDDPPRLVPGRPPESIALTEIIAAVDDDSAERPQPATAAVFSARLADAATEVLAGKTAADLLTVDSDADARAA